MPRIKKPKFTHVFVEDYNEQAKIGTKCNLIENATSPKGFPISIVILENGTKIRCYSHRIQKLI